MSAFPGSPRVLKGGIALLDPTTGAVQRIIVLQYNPDTIARTLAVQAMADPPDRTQTLRLKAPPVETIKVDAELDATDQLETPEQFADTVRHGIEPQLAALEALISPTSAQLGASDALTRAGTLEIVPMQSLLAVFVWSADRILPVRITDLSVTEEAFDPMLHPLRAKVSLGLRVLTVNDVGFEHKAGTLFMAHLRRKEALAALTPMGTFGALGIPGITS
jgi:hypothetical protein